MMTENRTMMIRAAVRPRLGSVHSHAYVPCKLYALLRTNDYERIPLDGKLHLLENAQAITSWVVVALPPDDSRVHVVGVQQAMMIHHQEIRLFTHRDTPPPFSVHIELTSNALVATGTPQTWPSHGPPASKFGQWDSPCGSLPYYMFVMDALRILDSVTEKQRAALQAQAYALAGHEDVFYSLWSKTRLYGYDTGLNATGTALDRGVTINHCINPLWNGLVQHGPSIYFDCEDLQLMILQQWYATGGAHQTQFAAWFTVVQLRHTERRHAIVLITDPHTLKPWLVLDGSDFIQGNVANAHARHFPHVTTEGANQNHIRPYVPFSQWHTEEQQYIQIHYMCCAWHPTTGAVEERVFEEGSLTLQQLMEGHGPEAKQVHQSLNGKRMQSFSSMYKGIPTPLMPDMTTVSPESLLALIPTPGCTEIAALPTDPHPNTLRLNAWMAVSHNSNRTAVRHVDRNRAATATAGALSSATNASPDTRRSTARITRA
jgi:hypothetical protein